MDKELLNYALCRFLLEVTNECNELYPCEMLYSLLLLLQMYCHSKGVYHKFLQDEAFVDVCNTLDNRMKMLSRQGVVTKHEKALPFTSSEEDIMWEKGTLGDDNPEQLVNTLIFLLGIHLSLHVIDEHKALKVGFHIQIKVKFDEENDCEFLEYTEVCSKNHQGGVKELNAHPKVIRAYQNKLNPAHCVVSLYKKYLGLQLIHDPKCSHNLYLRPLKHYSEHVWYSCQPLGVNTLQQVVSKLANLAQLPGKRSNHSLQASGPMRLFHSGVDDKLVCELTGHCSNAVLKYKHTSGQLKHHVSDVLYGNETAPVPAKCKSVSTGTSSQNLQENCQREIDINSTPSSCVNSQNLPISGSQTSQNVTSFNVNYNLPNGMSVPQVNVYPIINIPQELQLWLMSISM